MRTIDQLYDTVRYALFEVFGENRDEFLVKSINGGLKNHKFAAEIIEAWNEAFSDDYYPTDYWTEKWILLKYIAVCKRKRESISYIFDRCIWLIGRRCKRTTFSNEPYENNLIGWV